MNSLSVIVAFACLLAVNAQEPQPPAPAPGGRFGQCEHLIVEELVFIDQIHQGGRPGEVTVHKSEWHGDATIYCMIIENQHQDGRGSRAEVTDGGVGHHFFTSEIHSLPGKRLDYTVAAYARMPQPPQPTQRPQPPNPPQF